MNGERERMDAREERTALDRDDARLVARLRDAFAPEPLSPARRAAFDAGLQERLERRRRRTVLWPALGATLATAAVAALLVVRGAPELDPTPIAVAPAPAPAPSAAPASAPNVVGRAAALLYADAEVDDRDADDDGLPDEYAAIAGAFLDF